jgi:hypothetical protein
MRLRCPCCHAEFNPESALEDAAAREMMGLLADLPREVSRPLAAYLGLWRSKSRALAWERALRVAQEALSMSHNHQQLGKALSETVESLRKKTRRRKLEAADRPQLPQASAGKPARHQPSGGRCLPATRATPAHGQQNPSGG